MNRECESIQERLSAHLDAELARDELEELHKHLSTCENCQSLLEDYSKIGQLLREKVAQEVAHIDLASLREKVLEEIFPAARLRQTRQRSLDNRRRRPWQVAWALGLAMAIALIWLGPQLWERKDPARQNVLKGSIQEQLGQAIRDAAGARFTMVQITNHYQEQLGQLIRDSSGSALQEQLGLLIRDHAHSQWTLNRKRGQLQEKIGLLIQTQTRHHQDS